MKRTNNKRKLKAKRAVFTYEVMKTYRETIITQHDKRKKKKLIKKITHTPTFSFKMEKKNDKA